MHKLAVVAQNHLVNIVRLRSLVQDRHEYQIIPGEIQGGPDGALTMNCSCMPSTSVSFADKEILHCLVKGLVDEDIRKKVLGVVEEMTWKTQSSMLRLRSRARRLGTTWTVERPM